MPPAVGGDGLLRVVLLDGEAAAVLARATSAESGVACCQRSSNAAMSSRSRAPEPDVSPTRFHSTPDSSAARERLLDPTTTIPPDESAIRHAFG